ncbi:hypothetical protein BC937DRAFT_88298 [Endogone sp. FLAS-F59071]|nr:hypothetical protein BC937DRAFT_88298 [Endogone sp. FLAS-F59071]|eukprot:RUS18824.1 hypothetical protein BC937DRAFT_88298 [Endogone sp. FLAS-F59071]
MNMSLPPSSSPPPASTARYRKETRVPVEESSLVRPFRQNPNRYRTKPEEPDWESSNFEEDEESVQSSPEPTSPNLSGASAASNSNMDPNATPTRSRTPVTRSPFSSSPSSNLIFPTVDATVLEGTSNVNNPTPSISSNTNGFPSAFVSPIASTIATSAEERGPNVNNGLLNITTPVSPVPDCAAYIGQLRVMIVGDSGVGKTAFAHRLLRAIERFSGAPTADVDGHPFDIWSPAQSISEYDAPQGLTEYLASTAVETPFHITCDDNGTHVPDNFGEPLDRHAAPNVTVLDTPGYGETATPLVTFEQVVRYLNDAFARTRAIYASTISLQELQLRLSPGPGSGAHELIDVVVYLVHRVKRVDVAYLRQLAPYTFVLPCMVYEGSAEPQAVARARAEVRKSYEKLGVTWHKKKGMVFEANCDEKDAMLPFVIHRDSLMNDEGPVDDFGELCDLLFRPSRLDWWRHWNVVRFIEWLHRQRNDEKGTQEPEAEAPNTQQGSARGPQHSGRQETEAANTQQEGLARGPQHSGMQETEAANTQQEGLARGPQHSGRQETEAADPQEEIRAWREKDSLRQLLEEKRQREEEERRQMDEEMRQRQQRENETRLRYRGGLN